MLTNSDVDKVMHTNRSRNPVWAVKDIAARSLAAKIANPKFFNDPQHLKTIAAVKNILHAFYNVRPYENSRPGRTGPFTTLKVSNVRWTLQMDRDKQTKLVNPLRALGSKVEICKSSTGCLIHIY